MPLYRFETYQADRVLRSYTKDLEDDEAAERELARMEGEEGDKLREMTPDELLRAFAGGSIGFRARRAEDPEEATT